MFFFSISYLPFEKYSFRKYSLPNVFKLFVFPFYLNSSRYLNKVVFIQQLIIQYLVCKDLSFEYISRDQFAYKISIRSNTGK